VCFRLWMSRGERGRRLILFERTLEEFGGKAGFKMVWSSEAMRGIARTCTGGHPSCCMILYNTT
jgi:hypothetical protein